MKTYTVAVVGATGLVGGTILSVLESRNFPVGKLVPLASARSAGKEIAFGGRPYTVQEISEAALAGADVVFFAAGRAVSKQWAPVAAGLGALVVDNSSVFRMERDIPLVVPEVNPGDVRRTGIIANPNCSTIQSVVALNPLKRWGIKRVVYSSYQAVSGSGQRGLTDLDEGRQDFYPYPITGNVLPHIDSFLEDGYTKEERKMMDETRKILHLPELAVTATTVRVPVRYGHGVSINVQLAKPYELSELRAALAGQQGLVVQDDPASSLYPMPITAEGHDEVFVGRIRRDDSVENGVNLWVVADNVRKGAAVNAVQIAQRVLEAQA
jgi:aspartate-semialdehyde dehydrogenase